MKHRKHGLKALGLGFLLALSMMAITAVSAQAAEWLELVGGVSTKITTDLPLVGESDSSHWTLHSTIAGIVQVLILCKTLTIPLGNLKIGGSFSMRFSLSLCDTFFEGSGTPSAECDVINEPIVADVKGEQFLHNNRDYLYISPETGEAFTTIKFKAGCAVGESFNLKGHAVIEDCENLFRTHLVKHLIKMNESLGTTLFVAPHANDLKFGANAAVLLGSEWIKLANGNAWSGNAL